jgi:uncharacterized protein YdiU (UPF0061 family)
MSGNQRKLEALKMKIINSYYKLGDSFYKKYNLNNVKDPELLLFNQTLAKKLNLDLKQDKKYLADIFSGNELLKDSKPISLAYAGHQFGHFASQLGDGRAALLGEVKDRDDILFDIQLKGSGRTFFSRGGDGKCPLSAAIREYIVSEAMYFLQIPTTRSLALVKTNEFIQRESFVPAAIVTRVAASHIRIGTFEYFAGGNDLENLKIIADYSINRHYQKCKNSKNPYLSFLKKVINSQANLVSSWMSVGFIHGVMNTDNTSISGQTIDYGPCAFMDEYEKDKCFSFIDKMGRYNFSNQRKIILWNLTKFAESILPLIDNDIKNAVKLAEKELNKFPDLFDKIYFKKMAQKIGIFDFKESDKNLILDFLDILETNKIDFTNGFRSLSKILIGELDFYGKDSKHLNWHKRWVERLESQQLDLKKIARKMDKTNPILIPRNHIVERIIQKCVMNNDFDELKQFLNLIENPFKELGDYNEYYLPPKESEVVANTFCGT